MVTILSWNIGKNKTSLLRNAIKDIVEENIIDIIIFQEAYGQFVATVLNYKYDEISYPGKGIGSGVRIFLLKNTFNVFSVERTDNKKLVFTHLKKINGVDNFNIAAVHLYSKVNNTERQQLWKNLPLITKLKEYEKKSTNNKNTILVGDFNHNPYEHNLGDPNLINGIDNRILITNIIENSLQKPDIDYWYNPMWNFLGDYDYISGNNRVTGTFFRFTNDEFPMWNLFDGFLVRETLMDKIDFEKSNIIVKTKNISFVKPFIIRKDEPLINENISDHLPLIFTLKIN